MGQNLVNQMFRSCPPVGLKCICLQIIPSPHLAVRKVQIRIVHNQGRLSIVCAMSMLTQKWSRDGIVGASCRSKLSAGSLGMGITAGVCPSTERAATGLRVMIRVLHDPVFMCSQPQAASILEQCPPMPQIASVLTYIFVYIWDKRGLNGGL